MYTRRFKLEEGLEVPSESIGQECLERQEVEESLFEKQDGEQHNRICETINISLGGL